MRLVQAVAVAAVTLLITVTSLPTARAADELGKRYLFLQQYEKVAVFSLQRGTVAVWEPIAGPESTAPQGALVEFSGVLDQESSDVLVRLLERRSVSFLSLESPGGLVDPTLRLGQLTRAKKVATIVESGKQCFSACALLFLGGEARILGKQAVVGFHAPYIASSDGKVRYLQDISSSRVCAFLKKVMVAQNAAELCDYSLATKGMASFSLVLGRELGVFTAGEDEVMNSEAARIQAGLNADDGRWVACLRYASHALSVEKLEMLSDKYKEKTWPCWATRFGSGPLGVWAADAWKPG